MNVNEGFFRSFPANCRRGKGGQAMKVVIVQEGVGKQRTRKRGDVFVDGASRSSSDVTWKDNTRISLNESGSTLTQANCTAEGAKTIVALTEGRGEATCEVGIACFNLSESQLLLSQISDTASYINILTKINVLGPNEILIPLTMAKSRLTEALQRQFPLVRIIAVSRQTFNKPNGIQCIKQVCAPAWNSVLLILQHKYYALAAASALFAYAEGRLFRYFAKESMKVEYQESEGFAIIDVLSADKLELVACALPSSSQEKHASLRAILNHCQTRVGARQLRATLLQPPCSVPDIEERLDCVEELMKDPGTISSLQEHLKKLSHVDKLLTLGAVLPNQANNCSGRQLNYLLLLNSFLALLEPVREIVARLPQPFFVELQECLGCEELGSLRERVGAMIHCEAAPKNGERGTVERCFAVRAGVNGFLDILRDRFNHRLSTMNEYVQNLAREHNLNLRLAENTKKGYHIVLALNKRERRNLNDVNLPEEFIQVQRLNTQMTMKTIQILAHNARLDDIITEILKLSNVVIYYLLVETQKNLPIFYKVCELVAKLDLLQSLAKASCDLQYVRPTFSEFTEIVDGRHPLLDYLLDAQPVANNTYASLDHNMHIVTGPNGSGKSIYIRQIVLLQVMAQIGCFVPATSATFRVADRIFARIYLEDSMECGASAFTFEMKEVKYFLTAMTKNSLIVVDELCRSTSVKEGTALAAAICERFVARPAFVFLTTHYTDIAKLRQLYHHVKCWQMEAAVVEGDNRKSLRCTHRVLPGVCSLKEYAIYLAKCTWHEDTIDDVESILAHLETPENIPIRAFIEPAARLKYDLESELRILKLKGLLTADVVRDKLTAYQVQLQDLGFAIDWNAEDEDTDAEVESQHALQGDSSECLQRDAVEMCVLELGSSSGQSLLQSSVTEAHKHWDFENSRHHAATPTDDSANERPVERYAIELDNAYRQQYVSPLKSSASETRNDLEFENSVRLEADSPEDSAEERPVAGCAFDYYSQLNSSANNADKELEHSGGHEVISPEVSVKERPVEKCTLVFESIGNQRDPSSEHMEMNFDRPVASPRFPVKRTSAAGSILEFETSRNRRDSPEDFSANQMFAERCDLGFETQAITSPDFPMEASPAAMSVRRYDDSGNQRDPPSEDSSLHKSHVERYTLDFHSSRSYEAIPLKERDVLQFEDPRSQRDPSIANQRCDLGSETAFMARSDPQFENSRNRVDSSQDNIQVARCILDFDSSRSYETFPVEKTPLDLESPRRRRDPLQDSSANRLHVEMCNLGFESSANRKASSSGFPVGRTPAARCVLGNERPGNQEDHFLGSSLHETHIPRCILDFDSSRSYEAPAASGVFEFESSKRQMDSSKADAERCDFEGPWNFMSPISEVQKDTSATIDAAAEKYDQRVEGSPDMPVNETQFSLNLFRSHMKTSTPLSTLDSISYSPFAVDDGTKALEDLRVRDFVDRSLECGKFMEDYVKCPKSIMTDISEDLRKVKVQESDDAIFLENTLLVDKGKESVDDDCLVMDVYTSPKPSTSSATADGAADPNTKRFKLNIFEESEATVDWSFDGFEAKARPRFRAPQKSWFQLSKKEIDRIYWEKDRELRERGDVQAYGFEVEHRPNAQQILATDQFTTAVKTPQGLVSVTTTAKKPARRRAKPTFRTPLKFDSPFDVTLFSDRNSDHFDEIVHKPIDLFRENRAAPPRKEQRNAQSEREIDRIMQKYLPRS